MLQSTDRIVALQRALSKSTQGARSDTQVLLPASVQPVIELPGNFKSFNNAVVGADQSDSFRRFDSFVQNGANAGQVVNGPVLTPGLWHIGGYVEHHFTGTTNNGVSNQVAINDVDNATGVILLFTANLYTGTHVWYPVDQIVSLLFRAQLQVVTALTVALDALVLNSSIVCNKLL